MGDSRAWLTGQWMDNINKSNEFLVMNICQVPVVHQALSWTQRICREQPSHREVIHAKRPAGSLLTNMANWQVWDLCHTHCLLAESHTSVHYPSQKLLHSTIEIYWKQHRTKPWLQCLVSVSPLFSSFATDSSWNLEPHAACSMSCIVGHPGCRQCHPWAWWIQGFGTQLLKGAKHCWVILREAATWEGKR